MPSRYSSEGSKTDADALCEATGIELRTIADRAGLHGVPRDAGAELRGAARGPHRGEPAAPHPRHAADGALQQVPRLARAHHRQQERAGRRLLHALRRHRRRLRGDQGRAQAPRVRPVPPAQRAGRHARSSRRRCSPSRRRPSCAPTSATTSRCRPTRSSTRCSRPTSRTTSPGASSIAQGFDPAMVDRITRLVDLSEYKRRQNPPGPRISAEGVRQGPAHADHERLPRMSSIPAVLFDFAGVLTSLAVGRARRGRRRRPRADHRQLRGGHRPPVAPGRARRDDDRRLDDRGAARLGEAKGVEVDFSPLGALLGEMTVHDPIVDHVRALRDQGYKLGARHQQRARGLVDVALAGARRRAVRRRGRQLRGRDAQAQPGDLPPRPRRARRRPARARRCSSTTAPATSRAPSAPASTPSSSRPPSRPSRTSPRLLDCPTSVSR